MEALALERRLRHLSHRLLAVSAITGGGWSIAAAVLLVSAAVWLDLLWELPPTLRTAAGVAGLAAGALLFFAMIGIARRRCEANELARRMDRVAATNGQIESGVALIHDHQDFPPLTLGLSNLAVADANRLARSVPGRSVVPTRPILWPVAVLAGITVLGALLAGLLPRLVQTEWLRFTDPFGDHPPYSRVIYHVEPGHARVVYGSPFDVRARTEGSAVDRLDLVILAADSSASETLPMFEDADRSWRASVTNVTSPMNYYVRSSAGRSVRFHVDVMTMPKLENVRFRVTPPAYTNRPPYEGPLPQGGISGLPGTRVDVWVRSNRPLTVGTLKPASPGSPAVPLAAESPEAFEVKGSFAIRDAARFQLTVTDREGQESNEPFAFPVTVLTDEIPFVRMLDPREISLATPGATVPVTISAEDDYGVSRIQIFRSLNDSRSIPLDLPAQPPAPARRSEMIRLPLASYQLEPGDEIKLFARAEDTDPDGPKGAETPVAVIRIISQEDFEKMARAREGVAMLQAKYQQAQRRLEAAREEVDQLRKKRKDQAKPGKASPDEREDLNALVKRLKAEAAAIRAANQRTMHLDLDKHLSPQLERLARKLEEQAESLEKLARQEGLDSEAIARALDALAEKMDQDKLEVERGAIAPLERLGVVMPLIENASRFVILVARQRDLATRLASMKDKEKPNDIALRNRMRDLRVEQENIRDALGQLLDDIEDAATKLPEDPNLDSLRDSAREFVEKVRTSGATEAMNDAEAGLADFSGSRGHAGAVKAAEILEQFIERARGAKGMAGLGLSSLRFQPVLESGLGQTVEQLLGEEGLGFNQGTGGGGSSTQRNSNQNMGLYGEIPGIGELSSRDPRSSDQKAMPRIVRTGSPSHPGELGGASAPSTRTAGTAEAVVPVPYRRKVAEYFQRIAEETGK